MRGTLSIVFISIAFATIFTVSPDVPEYIPFESDANDGSDILRFVGGDGHTMLTGYWNLPTSKNNINKPPVIVMAHGLGLIQGKSLKSFVTAFRDAGYAVVTFDYATFGKSDGSPRHQINPTNHVADLQATISMVKEKGFDKGVDIEKIGLWGTSLGGGHVLMAAVNADPSVRAIVAQVPHIASGLESVVGSLLGSPINTTQSIIKFLGGLVKWISLKVLGDTAYFPIVGEPGSAALMQNLGDTDGYLGVLNPGGETGSGWKNAATTESGLRLLLYRPLSYLQSIKLPVLLISAELDTLCPAKYVQKAEQRITHAKHLALEGIGHFDVYSGKPLETMLSKQIHFFDKQLR